MWSIIIEPGKVYNTLVKDTFHLSMAALDVEKVKKGDDFHTVYVEADNNPRVILCHLSKSKSLFQCRLDHVFTQGTKLKFITSASANIHLTGYMDMGEEDELLSDMESFSEGEETPVSKNQEKGNKRKSEDDISKKSKVPKKNESSISLENDSESDLDSDEVMDFESDGDSDDEEDGLRVSDLLDDEADSDEEEDDDDNDEEEEDDDEDDEDEDSDEAEEEPVIEKKKNQQTPKKQMNGIEQKTPKNDQKTPKKTPKVQEKTPKGQDKTPKNVKTPMPKTPDANKSLTNGLNESGKKIKESKTPLGGLKTKPDTPLPKDKQGQVQKLNGGVVVHDLKVGDGALAKPGKTVRVYYIGRLKSSGKVFDSMQKGSGFSFGLQRGEVIKGWDIGIAGMKVGGKRKVICPPNMAYGAKGSPPEIPPNSTLVFDVELKHVN